MKTLKNFDTRELSKKEMNNVRGGQMFQCTIYDEYGNLIFEGALNYPTIEDALAQLVIEAGNAGQDHTHCDLFCEEA